MESLSYALLTISTLILFVSTVDSRRAPVEYADAGMKHHSMPFDATGKGVILSNNNVKTDCHHTDGFESQPAVTAFYGDTKSKETKSFVKDFVNQAAVTAFYGDTKSKETKSLVKDFDNQPAATAFYGDTKSKETKSQPAVTAFYGDTKSKETKSFMKDFDNQPAVTAFYGDVKPKEPKFVDNYSHSAINAFYGNIKPSEKMIFGKQKFMSMEIA